jgi:hypothetical protein
LGEGLGLASLGRGKAKAAPGTMGRNQRGQGEHYRGRSPVGPRPWRILYALAGGSCIGYRVGLSAIRSGGRARPR